MIWLISLLVLFFLCGTIMVLVAALQKARLRVEASESAVLAARSTVPPQPAPAPSLPAASSDEEAPSPEHPPTIPPPPGVPLSGPRGFLCLVCSDEATSPAPVVRYESDILTILRFGKSRFSVKTPGVPKWWSLADEETPFEKKLCSHHHAIAVEDAKLLAAEFEKEEAELHAKLQAKIAYHAKDGMQKRVKNFASKGRE